MDLLPRSIKKLLEFWELRFFLIFSLLLQTFLIILSPMRKRINNNILLLTLWSSYLLADWAATYTVGIISNSQGDKQNCSTKKADFDSDLLAFWAPFLLVHLGGPDTISAYSLEDNELWHRHLAGLLSQSCVVVYVFTQSLPNNRLWLPTILIFIDGLVKYGERTMSLYKASFNIFKESMLKAPDPGPNYAKLMEEYSSMTEANLPTRIEMIAEPTQGTKSVDRAKEGKLNDTEVVLYAYHFFKTFKGLIVDLIFSSNERDESKDFFLARNDEDAFKVIEVELNFIYESLFSKVVVVYTWYGYFLRFISFASVVTSLGLFYCVDKTNFIDSRDVVLSYILLIAAIALDVIAFIKLVTSDWLTVSIKKLPDYVVHSRDGHRGSSKSNGCIGHILQLVQRLQHRLFGRRWSEYVSCYNLISYCLDPRALLKEKIVDKLMLTTFLDSIKYVNQIRFAEDLREHIFDQLQMKSKMADDLYTAKEISAARGDWTLRVEGCTKLVPYILQVDYDQSLLVWHIATELCYNNEGKKSLNEVEKNHRRFSKLISDYMLYLLIMQPQMMSKVAGIGQIRFRDTCAEAKKFFHAKFADKNRKDKTCVGFLKNVWRAIFVHITGLVHFFHSKALENKEDVDDRQQNQMDACAAILAVNTEVPPVSIKGDRCKSALFDGCILAKELIAMGESRWLVMSKVWVEMMSYAAINCRATTHAQQLSKGGELITMVWFLMIHFGLGDQFQIYQGRARAKLNVGK